MTRFVYVLPAGRFRWEVRVDLDDLDLSHLSAVARVATPGPWEAKLPNVADRFSPWVAAGTYDVANSLMSNDAVFVATFDPPTVLELLNLIDATPLHYRLKRDALIAARAIALLIGGEVQPHDRRGRIQDPSSFGGDSPRRRG